MNISKKGETRRDVMIRGAMGAAAAATVGRQAKAQATPRIIRAVAVGKDDVGTSHDADISSMAGIPSYARPYITGLANWLALPRDSKTKPRTTDVGQYVLGTTGTNSYTIEYRERVVTKLVDAFDAVSDAHLLFCMSTSVGDAAIESMDTYGKTLPTVVISSHFDNFDQSYVCVVSAERPQLARVCLTKFSQHAPKGTVFHALHRQDYVPSSDALRRLGKRIPVTIEPVPDGVNPGDVVGGINTDRGTHGLLVLPADRFFAYADNIVSKARDKNILTFWTSPGATPATDWPPGANGAYGYSQDLCGRYMAERVGRIWDHGGSIPNPKDLTIPASDRSEKNWKDYT